MKTNVCICAMLCAMTTLSGTLGAATALTGPAKYLTFEGGTVTGLSNKSASGELVIPEEYDGQTITAIQWGAFAGCSGLTKVTIPGTISMVPPGAFDSCTRLTTVVLEEGVEQIAPEAFGPCPALTLIQCPSTFEGTFTNYQCPKVRYEIAADNPYFLVDGDFILNKATYESDNGNTYDEGSVLLYYQGAAVSSLTLPERITRIDVGAFTSQAIGTLSLHENVVFIGSLNSEGTGDYYQDDNTADALGNVSRVEVAEGNPNYYSQDGALLRKMASGRKLLRAPMGVATFAVPEGVTVIGTRAFQDCTFTKVTLPSTLIEVGRQAFMGCTKLTEVTIPKSVQSLVDPFWYANCTALRKITFQGNPPMTASGDSSAWPTNATGYYPKSRETAWKTAMAADDDGDDAKWHGLKMASYQDITGPAQYLTYEDYGDYLVVTGLSNKGVSGELVIPEEYDGKPVRDIAFTPFSSPFSGCSGLTKITIPGSIRYVYGECFSNCSRLKTIVLSEGVESWSGGIQTCPNLETLQVPASCTSVTFSSWECPKLRYAIAEGNRVYCVRDNAVLTKDGTTFLRYNGVAADEYAVPEGVQSIAWAFDGTPAIKHLVLPSTLRVEKDFMCYAFTNIGTVSVSEDNPWLASADGALFDKDKETLLFIPDVATCVVPEGVERLREGLFYHKKTLATVTLPSSLRAASLPLYESCPRLTTIRFPKGFETFDVTTLAAFVIPDDSNPALRRIEFAGNPPRFNGYVDFHYLFPTVATGYYPKSRETAWKEAMASDDDGNDAQWYGLKMAAYQDITGPAQYLTYDGGTVTGISNTGASGALVIPDEIADMPITGIYQDAFTDCTRITSVTVPGTVSSIGNRTFVRMTGLKEIVFQEGVQEIMWGAFSDCTALNRIVIPASCTSIGEGAFDTCYEIAFEVSPDNPVYKSVDGALLTKDGTTLICAPGNVTAYTIPDTVTEIARYAFGAGQSLGAVKLASVTVPESVETIPESAFAFGFGAVNVDAGNPNFSSENGVLYDKDRTALLHVPTTATAFTVPDSVVRIGMGALSECALTSIVFSDMGTLREIGDQAFWGSKLRSLTIPEGVESLGYEIAGCCESLTTIVFPETLTDLGGQGFTDCDALRRVEFHGLPPEGSTGVVLYHDAAKGYYPASYAPAWEAVLNADGTWGEGMPEYGLYALAMAVYDDAPTGTMAQLEFAENGEGVTLVKVPASFSGALTIPATWRVARGEGAYVRLPVTAIAPGAFAGCTRLTAVVVPGSVKTVGDGVFAGCSALTAVTFQEGVGRLEGVVFSDCAKLAKVKMPATLTAIARTPFLEACPEIAFEVASDNPVYQSSGGALLDVGIYTLNFADMVFGDDIPYRSILARTCIHTVHALLIKIWANVIDEGRDEAISNILFLFQLKIDPQ